MNFPLLIRTLGGFCTIFGAVLLIPAIFGFAISGIHAWEFLLTSIGCSSLGALLWFGLRNYQAELNHRTSFALVTFCWFTACMVGALPYYLAGALSSPLDAWFESVSGFTGTGATVLLDVESLDQTLLLWRSLTQWFGGMGIIVFFVAVLPLLGVGGVQLFRAELSGPKKDKITPRVSETARNLWLLYVCLTFTLAFLLKQAGMGWFDAVNHALATLSTGGFSTKNSGIAFYSKPTIEYLIAIFMFVGALNFGLIFRFIIQQDGEVLFDTELKWFIGVIGIATAAFTLALWGGVYPEFKSAFRHALFSVVSSISSTGYTTRAIGPIEQWSERWPEITKLGTVLLLVMGGMSGSTAGGIKCIRLVAALKQLIKQLKQVVHPSAILTVKANNHTIPEHVIDAIWGLIFLYFLVFSAAAGVLCAEGFNIYTASSAVFSSLSNIGPALHSLDPSGNYATLPALSKFTLTACMLLGRLEFFTVLVIFTIAYWRK